MFGRTSSSPAPPLSSSSSLDPPQTRGSSHSLPHSPPPCWASQARCDLAQAESQLRLQHDRYEAEIASVRRGVERAVLGARREERRLVERVEQDHRDAQLQLEQVQRENLAAVRVSQSLLEERLRKLAKLQRQIQDGGHQVNQNLLLKEISEFLQPWEISVSVKKVHFKPSSLPNALSFGDIRVQEQRLCLHVGGCGPEGQVCAIHSLQLGHDQSPAQRAAAEEVKGQGWTSGRVAKKISITTESEATETWKSEATHECVDDVFLAVPTLLQNLDSNGNATAETHQRSNSAPYSPRTQRKASLSPDRRKAALRRSLDGQHGNSGKLGPDSSALASPRISPRDVSHSCSDLTLHRPHSDLRPQSGLSPSDLRPQSGLSQSSDEHSLVTLCDSGRAASPTDSLDSSFTFIVSSAASELSRSSLNRSQRLSRSAVDLTRKSQINKQYEQEVTAWRERSCTDYSCTEPSHRRPQPLVSRSLSMSVIDGPSEGGGRREQGPTLREEDEGEMGERGQSGARLLRQFGKQGCGRADMTLPSGIHATANGHLYIVDCGNSRIQVMDCRGNVLQQIGSSSSSSSSSLSLRKCRNYFDVAVNSRGLVALSCASERALLVFSRHGRLLQTYGGHQHQHQHQQQQQHQQQHQQHKDELEAPRGVTVTRADEFLVADIRKGTLIALKLDPKTAIRVERTVVTGFHRPYLVSACPVTGLMAVSERGSETGRVPCVKVLAPDWNTIRILGVCAGMGPVLTAPWGLCIDADGDVLVTDWSEHGHRIVLFPSRGAGTAIIADGLSSPRGLTVLPGGHLGVSDSMHHCVKIYRYKENRD